VLVGARLHLRNSASMLYQGSMLGLSAFKGTTLAVTRGKLRHTEAQSKQTGGLLKVSATLTGPVRRPKKNERQKKQQRQQQKQLECKEKEASKQLLHPLVSGNAITALSQTLGLRTIREVGEKKEAKKGTRPKKNTANVKRLPKKEKPANGNRDLKAELAEHMRLSGIVAKHKDMRQRILAMRKETKLLTSDLKRAPNRDVKALSSVHVLEEQMKRAQSSSGQPLSLIPGREGNVISRNCSIDHPGSMSCTSTRVSIKGPGKVVVSMETVLQVDENLESCAYTQEDDKIALAARTLATEAMGIVKQRVRDVQKDFHNSRPDHERLVDLLADGSLEMRRHERSPYGHDSFFVEVKKNQNTDRAHSCQAIFKPRVDGNGDGWHRANVEWVAYELGLMLGMDYIPPVVLRKNVRLMDNEHEGALIYFVPNARELREVDPKKWGVTQEKLLSDTRVLDILLQNSDRHHGHFLYGEHWHLREKAPVLIDHAASFRKEAYVHMKHDNAFHTGELTSISASTYMRLRFLDKKLIRDKFTGVLTLEEIDGLMTRKHEILSYFDSLVAESGYSKTVME